jgi:hypothetical protein
MEMSVGSKPRQVRASGSTQAEEVTKEVSEKSDEPIEVQMPEERERTFRTPGFARMRMDWRGEDRPIIAQARSLVEGRIMRNFADAYEIMNEVYDLVREPEVDETTGEIKTDQWGWKVWRRLPSGGWDEDFTRLTRAQKEDFLFKITTRLFDWSQRSADAWAEAMFAKAQWEEAHSISYDAPMHGTIDDRRAAAGMAAAEERYFAIFLTTYSRKAEAIVRNLELLGQRLKDSMEW